MQAAGKADRLLGDLIVAELLALATAALVIFADLTAWWFGALTAVLVGTLWFLLRCDEVQGFLFGRPMPPEAFADFVRQHEPAKIRTLAESVLAEERDGADSGAKRRAGGAA